MKRRYTIGLLLLLLVTQVYGQREAANWYFGAFAGLDFNSGTPVPLLDGAIDTIEGCETMSDSDGNLLFYTDGEFVWNRNHQVMPNGSGLLGNFSSTQAAIAIPRPGSDNIYYLFTTDVAMAYINGGTGNGFNYSVVDMNRNGGLGDVILKNQPLLPQASENVTSVIDRNGIDYWVITHHMDSFYAFKVTAGGVGVTPRVSTVGPDIQGFENIRGAIKVSPNGDKLAIAHTILDPGFDGQFLLYDFDNDSGVVSNPLLLGDDLVFNGVEFSANSSKLYVTGKRPIAGGLSTDNIQVLQYDLRAPDIVASRFVINDFENGFLGFLPGALQIAMDRKIYHSLPETSLSVINSPNSRGLNADYRRFSVDLGGRVAKFGLPAFTQSFFETIILIENLCFGDTTTFTLDTEDAINSISWNFGDPASGANNTSNLLEPTHVFTAPGQYTVTLDVDFVDRPPQRFTEIVTISSIPTINSSITLVQCDVDGVEDGISDFNLNQAIPDIVISPADASVSFHRTMSQAIDNVDPLDPIGYRNENNSQTIFARVFKDATCFEIGMVVLEVAPATNLGSQVLSVCNRSSNAQDLEIDTDDLKDTLLDTYPNTDITFFITREDALLEENEISGIYEPGNVPDPEVFYRIESDNDCAAIGSFVIQVLDSPIIDDATVFICPNQQSVVLTPGPGFVRYEWSTGEMTESIEVSQPGVYTVTVFNGIDCDDTATYDVVSVPPPSGLQITISDFSRNNTITIEIDDPDRYTYSIDGGLTRQVSPVFEGLGIGPYTIQIWDGDCLVFEELTLIGGPPNFFTPNNDGFNDMWQVQARELLNMRIFIFDRYGKLLKEMTSFSEGWDGTYLGNPMPSSDYWYRIELEDGRMVSGNFTLKR